MPTPKLCFAASAPSAATPLKPSCISSLCPGNSLSQFRTRRRVPSRVVPISAAATPNQGDDSLAYPLSEPRDVISQPFDWHSQWYPVALELDLSHSKPTAVTVLSQRLVVWRTDTAASAFPASPASTHPSCWAVFRDACPHRGAALSEGRVDPLTGNLECSYHGWQFDGRAACTIIPQAVGGAAAASQLSCATALPSRTAGGIVFAWLGPEPPPRSASPPAVAAATETRPVLSSFARELPFPASVLLENVLDPAHIHFAHNGQIGRRGDAAPIDIRLLGPSAAGFAADYYDGRVFCRWRPPCLVEIENATGFAWAYYCVPVSGSTSRTIAVLAGARPTLMQRLQPRWLDHLRRNFLVDGDLILLHSQGMGLQKQLKDPPSFLPTTSDRLIVELRRWLSRNPAPLLSTNHGGSVFAPTRRELLDRLLSHTELCSGSCAGAYRNVRSLKAGSAVAGVGMFCIMYVRTAVAPRLEQRLGRGMPSKWMNGLVVLSSCPRVAVVVMLSALAACALYISLSALERRFVYVEDARRVTHR
jgi:phenylpropionate dioxygenase-like ring-hydroxylating dioxygenase large terminal subunit